MNLSEGYKNRLLDLAGIRNDSNILLESMSFSITKQLYDFLLPVYGLASSDNGFTSSDKKLLHKYNSRRKLDTYYFIGTEEEYKEALQRNKYMK